MSIWVVLKDMLLFVRDKKSFITLLFMPLILIAILGAAFGNLIGNDEGVTIPKFTIGFVDQDESTYSKLLKEEVFEKSLADIVELNVMTEDELAKMIKEKKVKSGIIIPENFSDLLESGKKVDIGFMSGNDAGFQLTVLESGINQFSQIVKGNISIGEIIGEHHAQEQAKLQMEAEQSGEEYIQEEVEIKEFTPVFMEHPISEESTASGKPPISSFQYYAVGMGVMFLLMTVVITVGLMIEEKADDVYNRLLITNLKNSQYLLGKFLGLIIICLIQFSLIIVGTMLLFKIDWGDSVSGIILTVISFTISAAGLGVFIGSFIKSEKTFSSIGIIGTQVLAAIGGSMVPLYLFPEWMLTISKVIPNSLALQMFLDIMSGSGVADIALDATILIGMGITLFCIAWIRLSWKGGTKFA